MHQPIRKLGILGLGEGRSAISAALSSPRWELRMVCDRNPELCRQRCSEFGLSRFTTEYADLLTDREIDAIAIYTPDHLHAEHIRRALEHGKHVICTKPLLDNLAQAAELIRVHRAAGKQVMVGQSSRFFEPMMHQRRDFDRGVIGELVTVEAYYNADHRWFLEKPWAREASFKWVFAGLSHPVDLVRWYLPEIEEVMGFGMLSGNGRKAGLKHEDTMHFVFRASDGRVARVSGAYSCPVQPCARDSHMSCILRGSQGCSQADYMDLRYSVTASDGREQVYTYQHKEDFYFRFGGRSHHAGEYQNYLDYFAICLDADRPAYPDLHEGIGTVALMQAMEQSLRDRRPVRVVSADVIL